MGVIAEFVESLPSQKVPLNPPASVGPFARLEHSLSVTLPHDFMYLYRLTDGTGDCDNRLYEFWPFDRILADGIPPRGLDSPTGCFTFADHFISAPELIASTDSTGTVIFADGWTTTPEVVARSFSEFAARYLTKQLPGLDDYSVHEANDSLRQQLASRSTGI